jgi:hypothetical protein
MLLDVPRRLAFLEVRHGHAVCLRYPVWTCISRGFNVPYAVARNPGSSFKQVRSFGTMTRDLRALADYLTALGVTHVAMEATGVLWKPVWNRAGGPVHVAVGQPAASEEGAGPQERRERRGMDCPVVAARLAARQFRATASLRDLRDLTRHRAQLVAEHTRVANRIHKVLEDANIKLGAVASDVLGKSGRDAAGLAAARAGPGEDGGVGPRRLAQEDSGVEARPGRPLHRASPLPVGAVAEPHQLSGKSDRGVQPAALVPGLDELLPVGGSTASGWDPRAEPRTIENVMAEIGVDMTRLSRRAPSGVVVRDVSGQRRVGGASLAQPDAPRAIVGCGGRWRKRHGRPAVKRTVTCRRNTVGLRRGVVRNGRCWRRTFAAGDHLPRIEEPQVEYRDLGSGLF